MSNFSNVISNRFHGRFERERQLDRPLETASLLFWPFSECKLVFYICVLALLDFTSTYAAIELSGNSQIQEVGLLAKWALDMRGFSGLLLMDIIAISTLVCLASGARYIYMRLGFEGLARAAFVFTLIPYFLIAWAVVVNNVLLPFL